MLAEIRVDVECHHRIAFLQAHWIPVQCPRRLFRVFPRPADFQARFCIRKRIGIGFVVGCMCEKDLLVF